MSLEFLMSHNQPHNHQDDSCIACVLNELEDK